MATRPTTDRDLSGVVNILVILQGPAYGDERAYNGLRLAGNLAKRDDVQVRVFCFGDAVGCAVSGQQVPNGYYRLDRMITAAARPGAVIGLCGTCMDARGSPTRRSSPPPGDPASTRSPTGCCGPTGPSPSDGRTHETSFSRKCALAAREQLVRRDAQAA